MKRRPRKPRPIEPLTFIIQEVSIDADGPVYLDIQAITCYFGSDRRLPEIQDLSDR